MIPRDQVTAANIQEMRTLAESGDIDLKENRRTFKLRVGRETSLTDDDLLTIHAMDDDGPSGDDWWVERILEFEGKKKEPSAT